VPIKEGERDLYVIVSKGDHVLVYTKDGRKLDIVITEADSKKQKIIGKGTEFYKQDYSWVSSPVYESSVDVNFSEIESIEIKLAAPNRSTPGVATVFAAFIGQLWLGGLIVGLFI
jgi:hypothetical protein